MPRPKLKAVMVFSEAGVPAKIFVGQPVTENWGPQIGKVVKAKKRKDGMIECVCEITDEKFLRTVTIPEEEKK